MAVQWPDNSLRGARRSMPLALRYAAAFCVLIAAFGVGICLGKLPYGRDREETLTQFRKEPAGSAEVPPSLESDAERPLAPLPDPARRMPPANGERFSKAPLPAASQEPWDVVRNAGDGFRLRIRSVERLSSSDTLEGSPVTFVTEHAILDASGGVVPAGSTVEGIIAQAVKATSADGGRLVIRIHTIRVGTRLLTLDALPFAQDADEGDKKDMTVAASPVLGTSSRPVTRPKLPGSLHAAPEWLAPHEQKKPAPVMEWSNLAPAEKAPASREVVLPKEAILEFELLQRPNRETVVPAVVPPVKPSAPFAKPVTKTTPGTPA
jgi:hypothetical protein